MPLDRIQIASERPHNEIHYHLVIPSTMTESARLITEGAPHGTVVIAEEQSAGFGRFGRHWISEPETGIYLSIILRLGIPPAILPVLTLGAALATAEAIEQTTGLKCDLRWPNDVLIDERKVAGILAQLHDEAIIVGIGINVNHTSLPGDLRTPATSIRMCAGHSFDREPIVIKLLESLEHISGILVERGAEAVLNAFAAASSYVAGRRVRFESDQHTGIGTTMGLDQYGFLRILEDGGVRHTLYTGSIRPHTP